MDEFTDLELCVLLYGVDSVIYESIIDDEEFGNKLLKRIEDELHHKRNLNDKQIEELINSLKDE